MDSQILYWGEIDPWTGEILDCGPVPPVGLFGSAPIGDIPWVQSHPGWSISMTFRPTSDLH